MIARAAAWTDQAGGSGTPAGLADEAAAAAPPNAAVAPQWVPDAMGRLGPGFGERPSVGGPAGRAVGAGVETVGDAGDNDDETPGDAGPIPHAATNSVVRIAATSLDCHAPPVSPARASP